MKSELIAKHDEQLEMIEMPGRQPFVPRSTNVDDKAAAVLQDSMHLSGKGSEPIEIMISLYVSVLFLANQSEWRTSDEKID